MRGSANGRPGPDNWRRSDRARTRLAEQRAAGRTRSESNELWLWDRDLAEAAARVEEELVDDDGSFRDPALRERDRLAAEQEYLDD